MSHHNSSKGGVYPPPSQPQPPSGSSGQGHGHLTEHATGQISDVGMQGAAMAAGSAQPGPDMGQPHYASQLPGANPYQGAPMAPDETQAGYAWGEGGNPDMAASVDSTGGEKQGGYGKQTDKAADGTGCADAAAAQPAPSVAHAPQDYPMPGQQPPQFAPQGYPMPGQQPPQFAPQGYPMPGQQPPQFAPQGYPMPGQQPPQFAPQGYPMPGQQPPQFAPQGYPMPGQQPPQFAPQGYPMPGQAPQFAPQGQPMPRQAPQFAPQGYPMPGQPPKFAPQGYPMPGQPPKFAPQGYPMPGQPPKFAPQGYPMPGQTPQEAPPQAEEASCGQGTKESPGTSPSEKSGHAGGCCKGSSATSSSHAMPGYAPPYPNGAPFYGPPPGTAHAGQMPNPQDMAMHYGHLYGLIRDAANGQPDISGFMNFFQTVSSDFWKGALVGTGITLLFTTDAPKAMLAKGLAGLSGAAASAEQTSSENNTQPKEEADL
ncbi:hypothetical protein [Desulfobotulus mexicanus]|uniref:Uncharacterized protein n=1 Tax=Desulfobotulus mexicanus TaxID=2586642 RepID=A0A5Q4VCA9_9BACT|nr:hypothetical protein [Desulfobotulus mexicanus]TYT75175.1 hypothetical protein FIM25_05530 [Desulfobotulus mexicanus]